MNLFHFDASISSAVAGPSVEAPAEPGPLDPEVLRQMHRYWQAANYLTVGQIYLRENPLLRDPLRPEQIKPRLLGHWGTSPGLNMIYLHLNRLIRLHDADIILLTGPGHGGPAILANVYLEGTYSEIYPKVSSDLTGMQRLFHQFSTPGGVPSHVSVPTPGSIHEGGELGYVLTHAFGAAFDNPDLIVAAVVGDGEAETGPLAASWKSTDYLNPQRDGAVLPILHLNGYKISGPTVLGRAADADVRALLQGNGYHAHFVEGENPERVHQQLAAAFDASLTEIRAIQQSARNGHTTRHRWPAIVLRTPKGWTGPVELGGVPVEGTFRAHQVPLPNVSSNPEQLQMLDAWMRSYHPEELFDADGRLDPALSQLAPVGDRRMGSNPHANGGRLLQNLELPPVGDYAIPVSPPGTEKAESTRQLGKFLRDVYKRNASNANFRLFCPDETDSNRLGDVFEVDNRCFQGTTISLDDHIAASGRVMEVLSEHLCQGWLEGYLLSGRHGLFASYEAFAMVSASMTVQHAKWLEAAGQLDWRASVASLNILLTSTCWRQDHNGFSHQGPGLIDTVLAMRGTITGIYLPPDANSLLHVANNCFRSRDQVNLIIIDKQPELQWLDIVAAEQDLIRGASIWQWAGNEGASGDVDVILACAGDTATQETVAAAWWLQRNVPDLRIRVVNVIDLMSLATQDVHPHGVSEADFVRLFTADKPVIFAFHGYQQAIHQILHGRINAERFHVRGYREQGTTTTPFMMVALNGMSRYQLAAEALRRSTRLRGQSERAIQRADQSVQQAANYAIQELQDMPEISDWIWSKP